MLTRRSLLASAALATLPTSITQQRAAAQALAKEQVVRVGLGFDDITNLDPHAAVLSSDIPIVGNIYEGLLNVPGGNLTSDQYEPALAERWESSPDKKTWTFHLRKGVAWHGGHGEFSSEDVKFSIERVAGKDYSSPFKGNMSKVERVETDGPSIVRVILKEPNAYFLQLVVNYQAGYMACKRAIEAGVNPKTQPVGTGPFQIQSYQSRDKIILVRNDKYWGTKPTIEQLVYQFMSQQATRELALRTKDVNAIDLDSRQDVIERLRRQKEMVDVAASGVPNVLYVNLTKKPFDDIRVRRALAHATDRANLASFIGQELFAEEHSSVPGGYTGHIDDVTKYPHDVGRAKALLAEAGMPNGFTTEVICSNSTLYLPIMQVMQEQWKQAGINMVIKVVDHPTFHRLIRQDASPLVIYNADRYPKTAQVYYEQFYAGPAAIGKPTAITNFSHYGDAIPGIDDLLAKSRAATDPEEAKKLWAQMQKKVSEDVPSIPLFNQKMALGRSATLDIGYKLGNLPFYHFAKARILAG